MIRSFLLGLRPHSGLFTTILKQAFVSKTTVSRCRYNISKIKMIRSYPNIAELASFSSRMRACAGLSKAMSQGHTAVNYLVVATRPFKEKKHTFYVQLVKENVMVFIIC